MRELVQAARGSQEVGFTEPRAHILADPCTVLALRRKREIVKELHSVAFIHYLRSSFPIQQ